MLLAGVYCDRDNAVVVPSDGYVCWNFAGSIPSDIFSPLLVRVHEALVICCCLLNVVSYLYFIPDLAERSLVNNMLTGDIPDEIYSLSNPV
jgi:hypothetical protein